MTTNRIMNSGRRIRRTSRSDGTTVAVGFIPRLTERTGARCGATDEFLGGLQSSLRDELSIRHTVRGLKATANITKSLHVGEHTRPACPVPRPRGTAEVRRSLHAFLNAE